MKNLLTKKGKSILIITFLLALSSCGKEDTNVFDSEEVKNTILEEEAKSSEFWGALVLSKEDLSSYMGDELVEAGDGPLSIITNRDYDFVENFVTCVREGKSLWGVSLEIEWYGTSYLQVKESSGSIKAASSLAYRTNKEGFIVGDNLLETGKCLIKPMTLVMDSIAKAHKGLSSEVSVSEIKPLSLDKKIYALKFTSEIKTDKFGSMPVNLYYIISYKDTLLVENFIVSIETKDNSKKDTEIIMALVESKYDAIDSKSEPSSLDKKETPTSLDETKEPSSLDKTVEPSSLNKK